MIPQRPVIGIIGGRGRMGRWFRNLLEKAGLEVIISDIDTPLSSKEVAHQSDFLIFSLPMDVFPEVVQETAPLVPEHKAVTDLCSLKERQVACMLENSKCQVIGTHPLFGPAEKDIKGRRVALCPGRGREWLKWWRDLLSRHGAIVTDVSPSEHDRIMAWVQALNHFILLSLGKALEDEGMDLQHVAALSTPSFERQMEIVGRLCKQDPGLYSKIQMANPYTDRALASFMEHGSKLMDIIHAKDKEEFITIFEEVQKFGKILLQTSKKKS